jgi:hypothetical protein
MEKQECQSNFVSSHRPSQVALSQRRQTHPPPRSAPALTEVVLPPAKALAMSRSTRSRLEFRLHRSMDSFRHHCPSCTARVAVSRNPRRRRLGLVVSAAFIPAAAESSPWLRSAEQLAADAELDRSNSNSVAVNAISSPVRKAAEATCVVGSAASSASSGRDESLPPAGNPLVPEEGRRRRELTVTTRI